MLTVGSLFSGIGGLDLGLERAGMKVIWNCEIDPYASRVLKKHWPDILNIGNVKDVNWNDIPRPDVLCGGYPCQPFSTAGNRKGSTDERHLWPWVREAISVLRPRYAILENVRGHVSLGLPAVLGDLAELRYDAEWQIISAASQHAPHLRERVFIVAYPSSVNVEKQEVLVASKRQLSEKLRGGGNCSTSRNAWTTNQPSMVGMADGLSCWVDRSRAIGNAVVPQVAEYVGRLVMEHANAY